ncbi:cell wall-binding repeat-containing protein [Desulfosporosinus sp. SB140]|uniref:cell wall-binding repeat-containing protein n=1 Tax=Desulfosporosinus paludis TaxID=3115649 RepID=UPI00388F4BE9
MSLKKKSLTLCLILTLIILVFPVLTLATTSPIITRLAGIDRYETASQIAKSGWSQSDYAILAFGEDYPDALSAAPLAKKYNAPILLTNTSSLPITTKQTLLDLQVKNVFIIGGTGVISQSVESELQTMGLETTRIYGSDRYATAIQVAQQVTSSPSTLFVVTGEDYPDALLIAPIASVKQIPIILVPNDSVPDSVKNYISTLNVSKTYVIGYSDIISDQVAQQFPNPERILGSDKYARNIAVNQLFNTDFNSDSICIATGEGFADALTGAAYSAKISEPIILINNDSPANTRDYYQQRFTNASHIYVFGGTGIISDPVINNLNPSNVANGDTSSPQGVKLNKSSLALSVGKTETLRATLDMPEGSADGNDTNVTWVSSNPAVATVNLGTVVGLSEGTAVITAKTFDESYAANCLVTVNNPNGKHMTMNLSSFIKAGANTTTFRYQILNEMGKDITATIPASQLSAVASIRSSVSLDPIKGIGTITYNSSSDINKPIIITLVDLTNGITVSLDSASSTGSSSYTYPIYNPVPDIPSPSQYSDQKINKITITSTKLALADTDGNDKIGYATYIVNDQYGNDITNSSLADNLTFTTDVGTITGRNGLLEVRFRSNLDPASLAEITINGIDPNSGITTTATLMLVPMFGKIE